MKTLSNLVKIDLGLKFKSGMLASTILEKITFLFKIFYESTLNKPIQMYLLNTNSIY